MILIIVIVITENYLHAEFSSLQYVTEVTVSFSAFTVADWNKTAITGIVKLLLVHAKGSIHKFCQNLFKCWNVIEVCIKIIFVFRAFSLIFSLSLLS